jgi:hypothetical protein
MGCKASSGRPGWLVLLSLALWVLCGVAAGDETDRQRVERLEKLSPEQKEELLRKKQRFEQLSPEEQNRLRELHAAIAADPQADVLEETIKRYNQWLATLPSPKRAALLVIQDPKERIARIKEEMRQQEEQRFREFLPALPESDQEVIRQWIVDFVVRNADAIREHLREDTLRYIDEAPDEAARRERLVRSWEMRRREPGMPYPAGEDVLRLVEKFSAETREKINAPPVGQATATAEERQALRQQRVLELVRAALVSRTFPQPTREELLQFYANMKPDDPRRMRLEGREGDDLLSELRRQWNFERWRERGGPGAGWGPRPPGGPFGRGERDDERGGKGRYRGPDDGRPPPPPPPLK